MATRERLDKHEKQLDKHDRQIAAILALVKQGMRMLVENRNLMVETRKDIRALAAAQKRTDEELREFIASLRRGGNGHRKQKLDLQ